MTATAAPAPVPSIDPCPGDCLGRATADVDGDGRPDQIGLSASPPLSGDITAGRSSKLLLRVVFATGRVAEYHDTALWAASLVGAFDLNGDGHAEIFYFNNTGANLYSGYIAHWDGSQLIAVNGPDGKPFNTFTSGYAMGGDGFACADNSYVSMTLHYNGPADGWVATKTTYQLNGDTLVKVADNQPIRISKSPAGATGTYYVPPEYDQIIGVHCPGVVPGYPYVAGPSAP